jgi:hypothetical protein
MSSLITKAFEYFSAKYLKSNNATIEQYKVIDCIKTCKTPALGYNIQACEDCGTIKTHYNSCGNRHCPNCQAINKEKWILSKKNDTLPVIYHHTVFTVPAQLRMLFLFNKVTHCFANNFVIIKINAWIFNNSSLYILQYGLIILIFMFD